MDVARDERGGVVTEYPYTWRWGTCGGKYPAIGKRKVG